MRGWMMIFGGIGIPGTALGSASLLSPGMLNLCVLFLSLFLVALAIKWLRWRAW